MSKLTSLTFTELPDLGSNTISNRRSKLVDRLEQQLQLFKNPNFTVKSHHWKTKENGERVRVDEDKPLKPWWFEDANGMVYMTVRIGNRKIEFEKGKSAIKVGPIDKLETVISTLIASTQSGEMDGYFSPRNSTKP
jgi:hypothetical protein